MAPGSPLSNRPLKCATMPQAVGLLRRGRMVFDPEVAAQQIEFALAGGSAFAQTEPAVGEPLAARHATRPDPMVPSMARSASLVLTVRAATLRTPWPNARRAWAGR